MKQDKYRMRSLLRALLVWGKTFRYQGTSYQFCYPTGFLKFAHRMLNLMDIESAFWIVVGLVRHYPRLWCLEQSALVGDTKSVFRFEHTALKAAIEVNYPEVAKKLYLLGLPLELLVYESLTSLYSDQFHSDTLYRIWDLMIFYMNTNDRTTKRRGVQLILAPALLIISEKADQIVKSQTIKDVIAIYNDGCGISYNPNVIITKLNEIIKKVFVAEPTVDGGTGAAQAQSSGILGFLGFGGPTAPPTMEIDVVRKRRQDALDQLVEPHRAKNEVVSAFLFDTQAAGKDGATGARPLRDGDMAFDDAADGNNGGSRPGAHQTLDYESWRKRILKSMATNLAAQEDIEDDDLFVLEDVDVANKAKLDVSAVQIYLHRLENWHGTGVEDEEDDERFRVEIQYGNLNNKTGKFEVRSQTKVEGDENVRADADLQFFDRFKYKAGFNHIKVKIATARTRAKIGHCYIDLRGLQQNKFILVQKTMNNRQN